MDLVGGRYELLEELGRGGFGCVFLARELAAPDTLWALKEIDFSDMGAAECEALHQFFDREQKILSWLSHPAIAQRREVIIDGARLYLVMEYVEGADMQRVVSANFGSVSPGAAVGLVEHICEILFYLHSQKPYPIVFRDLKPSNLMLTTTGVVKLIDFGIARMYRPATDVDVVAEAADVGASNLLAAVGASQVLGDGKRPPPKPVAAAPVPVEAPRPSAPPPYPAASPATEYLGTLPGSSAAIPEAKPAAQAPTEWLGIAGLGSSQAPPRPTPVPTTHAPVGATEFLGTLPGSPAPAPPPPPPTAPRAPLAQGPGATEFLGTLPGSSPRAGGPAPTEYLGTRQDAPAPPPPAPAAEGPSPTEWLGTVPAGPAPTEWLGTTSGSPPPPRAEMAAPPRAAAAPPRQEHDSLCLGTPGYAAPEQYPGSGLIPDPRADIYALGVILHQLLSQQNPAQLEVPLPPIRRFNSSVHPDLEQIVARATAPDREQRYSSVKMFSKALAEFRQAKLLLSPQGVERELKTLASHYRPPVRKIAKGDLVKQVNEASQDVRRVGSRFDDLKRTQKKDLNVQRKLAVGTLAVGGALFLALLLVPGIRVPAFLAGLAAAAWFWKKRTRKKRR